MAVHPCLSLSLGPSGHRARLKRLDDGLMTLTCGSFGCYCSFTFCCNRPLSIDTAFNSSDHVNFPGVTSVTSAADLPKIGHRLRAKDASQGRTADTNILIRRP
jgi:hypothetical protein